MLVLKSACNGKDRRYGPTWKLSHQTIGDNAHLCHAKQGVIAQGALGLGAFYLPIHVDGINSDSLLKYPSQNTSLKWPNGSFMVYAHFWNAARDKQVAMATVSVGLHKKILVVHVLHSGNVQKWGEASRRSMTNSKVPFIYKTQIHDGDIYKAKEICSIWHAHWMIIVIHDRAGGSNAFRLVA